MTEVSTEYVASTTNEPTVADGYSSLFVEYRLMKEFVLFQQQTIQNVYLVPSHESPFKWFGVLFIHEGLYRGAVLRFTFHIPSNYPVNDGVDNDETTANNNHYPLIYFDHSPFHPLVDPETGKFDSTRIIAQWNPRVHQFWQLIVNLKKAFINVEKELNYEVGEGSTKPEDVNYLKVVTMYQENQELFVNKIAQTVETSKSLIYQPPKDKDDAHAIIFTEVDPTTLESWKNRLLNLQSCKETSLTVSPPPLPSTSSLSSPYDMNANRSNIGLSWVQNDVPFSRPIV